MCVQKNTCRRPKKRGKKGKQGNTLTQPAFLPDTVGVVSIFLLLLGGVCLCSRGARNKFLRPVTSRWTRLSYATGLASPARDASQAAARGGGDAHMALVTEAEPMSGGDNKDKTIMGAAMTTNDPRETMRSGNHRSFLSAYNRASTAASSARTSRTSSNLSLSRGPLRQFPITKTFGRASWETRSWYGRSWHGNKSWTASQTFAPPMTEQVPDPPVPVRPPAATYSVFRTASMASSSEVGGAEINNVYGGGMTDLSQQEMARATQTRSYYGTGLQPTPSQSSSTSSSTGDNSGNGQVVPDGGLPYPQVVVYSPRPRVSAQNPVIVDPGDYNAAGWVSREASQGSMHGSSEDGGPVDGSPVDDVATSNHSMVATDGSHGNNSSSGSARGDSDTLPRRVPVPALLTAPPRTTTQTVSRFSQVSELSSASANTGYSWDEGASDAYRAAPDHRDSTLSQMAGGFGLSIVGDRNNALSPAPRNQ